jgi:hypothetical protein
MPHARTRPRSLSYSPEGPGEKVSLGFGLGLSFESSRVRNAVRGPRSHLASLYFCYYRLTT